MSKNMNIPPWLRSKVLENRPEEPEKPLNRITVAVAVGAVVSYIGLLVLEASQSDNDSHYSSVTPAKVHDKKPEIVPTVTEEVKKVSIRKLTSRDLPYMKGYLEKLFEHVTTGDNASFSDSCSAVTGKFSSHAMISPPSYLTTKCYADAGLDLYKKNNDAVFLELANYYYRRCLYLINGQFMGRFRKPSGGNDQIKKRQIDVFEAMDEISEMIN